MTQNATPAAEWASAADLRPWDRNPRKNDEAANDVARSIIAYGFGAPIVARRGGDVIAGHTRLKAVALLPAMWKRATPADRETWSPDSRNLATAEKPLVPVRYLDVTEQQARALNLADNRLGEKAEWNDDALAAILREMDAEGEDLGPLGWSDEELAKLLGEADSSEDDDDDADIEPMQGTYAVLVTCTDERHQRTVLEQLAEEGLECRAWNL